MNAQADVGSRDATGRAPKKAVVAAAIGNFIEYYDFIVYGYFAVVISTFFFPSGNPVAALLLTFSAFAVSYFVRPLGALIFGHFGDKFGQRTPLAVSILGIAFSTALYRGMSSSRAGSYAKN